MDAEADREIRALAARVTTLEAKLTAQGFATSRVVGQAGGAQGQIDALGVRATNLERGQATQGSQQAALTARVTALEAKVVPAA